MSDDKSRILFVCTGNICRSPTAEAVARQLLKKAGLADEVEVESAGIQGFHAGDTPDLRSRQAAARRGYDLSGKVARKLELADFQRFDLLLAMDASHLEYMHKICPEPYRHKLSLFMRFAPDAQRDEVPDPYYGGEAGFDAVLNYCEQGVAGIIDLLVAARAESEKPD